MASFLRAAEEEDWEAAAHLLDLGELPVDRQAELGPRLAHQLYDVIDRKVVLDWSTLLDRPDALQSQGGDTERWPDRRAGRCCCATCPWTPSRPRSA